MAISSVSGSNPTSAAQNKTPAPRAKNDEAQEAAAKKAQENERTEAPEPSKVDAPKQDDSSSTKHVVA